MNSRALVSVPLAAVAIAACFSNGSGNSGVDAGVNVEPDASISADGGVALDAYADTTIADAAPVEASTADSPSADASPGDAQTDAGAIDAGPCANVDAGAVGYAATVLADSPAAYWRFGEASGTAAVDETGHVTDMTYYGTPTYGVAGAIANDTNTAISFNGTNAYAQSATAPFDFSPALPFSIELWLMPTATQSGFPRLVSREFADGVPADRKGYLLSWAAGEVSQERLTDGGDDAVATPSIVPLGVYSHIVATFDGATSIIYVNGQAAASVPGAGALTSITQAFAIAGFPYGAYADYFEGVVDEVAVYSVALPADRALVHYCVGAGL
jgi:Concanavalin A-like lectin/glucanases superfamily